MKFITMRFSPFSCLLLLLKSKYSHHSAQRQRQPTLLLEGKGRSFICI